MRILTGIDLPFTPNCGSMILVDDLYSGLQKKAKVRFLALDSNLPSSWSKINDIKLLPVVKKYKPEDYPGYLSELRLQVKEQIADFKPDLIHVQHLSFGMALVLSELKQPKIAICHGTDVQFSQDSDFHTDNMKFVYKNAEKVIFPTEKIRKEFFAITKLNSKDVILPWGLPDAAYSTVETAESKTKKLLYAGRLDLNKNVQILIKAMVHLNKEYTLTVIGEGDQKNNLMSLVGKLKLKNRVDFVDFLPRRELWERFNSFGALIIPTKKIEAFGLTPVEAQAHNLPVIYSRTNGLIEVLGESGAGFNPSSAKDLANKIVLVFNDDNYRKYIKLGMKNAQKYKISKLQKEILKISMDLL